MDAPQGSADLAILHFNRSGYLYFYSFPLDSIVADSLPSSIDSIPISPEGEETH